MKSTLKSKIMPYIECGTVDEVLTIIGRLHFLPEFGMTEEVRRIAKLAEVVCQAELKLAEARSTFRLNAERLMEKVIKNWTAGEIEKATGY